MLPAPPIFVPSKLTAIIVPSDAAAILTMVLPSNMAERKMPGCFWKLSSRSANLTSLESRCLTRILLSDIMDTSALEKNADNRRQTKIRMKYKVRSLSIYSPAYPGIGFIISSVSVTVNEKVFAPAFLPTRCHPED